MADKCDSDMHINPDPFTSHPKNSEIIVVGNVEAEDAFLKRFRHAGQTKSVLITAVAIAFVLESANLLFSFESAQEKEQCRCH